MPTCAAHPKAQLKGLRDGGKAYFCKSCSHPSIRKTTKSPRRAWRPPPPPSRPILIHYPEGSRPPRSPGSPPLAAIGLRVKGGDSTEPARLVPEISSRGWVASQSTKSQQGGQEARSVARLARIPVRPWLREFNYDGPYLEPAFAGGVTLAHMGGGGRVGGGGLVGPDASSSLPLPQLASSPGRYTGVLEAGEWMKKEIREQPGEKKKDAGAALSPKNMWKAIAGLADVVRASAESRRARRRRLGSARAPPVKWEGKPSMTLPVRS